MCLREVNGFIHTIQQQMSAPPSGSPAPMRPEDEARMLQGPFAVGASPTPGRMAEYPQAPSTQGPDCVPDVSEAARLAEQVVRSFGNNLPNALSNVVDRKSWIALSKVYTMNSRSYSQHGPNLAQMNNFGISTMFMTAGGDALIRGQSVSSSGAGQTKYFWENMMVEALGAFLNVTYFPTVFWNQSLRVYDSLPFAVFYSSVKPSDKTVGHLAMWTPIRVRNNGSTVMVDMACIADQDALRSLVSSLETSCPMQDSFVWFSPIWFEGYAQAPQRIMGASFGLALAACIMGAAPLFYTGFIKRIPPDIGNWSKSSGDFVRAFHTDDVVEDVKYIPVKVAYCLRHQVPIVIPHLSAFMQSTEAILKKHPSYQQLVALGMRAFFTTTEVDAGVNYAERKSLILAATSVPEACQLGAICWINWFNPGNTNDYRRSNTLLLSGYREGSYEQTPSGPLSQAYMNPRAESAAPTRRAASPRQAEQEIIVVTQTPSGSRSCSTASKAKKTPTKKKKEKKKKEKSCQPSAVRVVVKKSSAAKKAAAPKSKKAAAKKNRVVETKTLHKMGQALADMTGGGPAVTNAITDLRRFQQDPRHLNFEAARTGETQSRIRLNNMSPYAMEEQQAQPALNRFASPQQHHPRGQTPYGVDLGTPPPPNQRRVSPSIAPTLIHTPSPSPPPVRQMVVDAEEPQLPPQQPPPVRFQGGGPPPMIPPITIPPITSRQAPAKKPVGAARGIAKKPTGRVHQMQTRQIVTGGNKESAIQAAVVNALADGSDDDDDSSPKPMPAPRQFVAQTNGPSAEELSRAPQAPLATSLERQQAIDEARQRRAESEAVIRREQTAARRQEEFMQGEIDPAFVGLVRPESAAKRKNMGNGVIVKNPYTKERLGKVYPQEQVDPAHQLDLEEQIKSLYIARNLLGNYKKMDTNVPGTGDLIQRYVHLDQIVQDLFQRLASFVDETNPDPNWQKWAWDVKYTFVPMMNDLVEYRAQLSQTLPLRPLKVERKVPTKKPREGDDNPPVRIVKAGGVYFDEDEDDDESDEDDDSEEDSDEE